MAKRKSKNILWEKLVLGVVCSIVALLTGLYVYLTYRAVATEQLATDTSDRYFSILYVDHDDTLILSDLFGEGLTRQVPIEPTREGYIFQGWENDMSSKIYTTQATINMVIVNDVCFKAVYSPITLTVKYLDSDYTELNTLTYKTDEVMPEIDNPVRDGKIFTGWDTAVNGDTTTRIAMYVDETSKYICRIGNKYYTSLQEAVDSIPYNDSDMFNEDVNDKYWRTRYLISEGEYLDLIYFNDIIIHLFRDIELTEKVSFDKGLNWGAYEYVAALNLIDDVKISYTGTGNMLELNAFNVLFNANKYTLTLDNPNGYAINTSNAFYTAFDGNIKVIGEGISLNRRQYSPSSEIIYLYGNLESNVHIKYTYEDISGSGKKSLYGGGFSIEDEDAIASKINVILTIGDEVETENVEIATSKINIENIEEFLKVFDASNKDIEYKLEKQYVEYDAPEGPAFDDTYYVWNICEVFEKVFETLSETSQIIITDISEQPSFIGEVINFNPRYLNTAIDSKYEEIKLTMKLSTTLMFGESTSTEEVAVIFTKGDDGIYRADLTYVNYFNSITIDLSQAKPNMMIAVEGDGVGYITEIEIIKIEAK